jgi:hypothetical protein
MTTYTIPQLNTFPSVIPTGNELMEISNNPGSYQMPIAIIGSSRQPTIISSGGTYSVGATQFGDILVNVASATTFNLPAASGRNGVPVAIIDIGGNAGTYNITIDPDSPELIIGLSSIAITNNYGGLTLWPISTGGWYMK